MFQLTDVGVLKWIRFWAK